MSSKPTTTPTPEQQNPLNSLWARWGARKDWQDKLYKSAAHKSLDIPEDMGDINVRRSGISGWAMAAMLAAAGGTFLGYEWLNRPIEKVIQQPGVQRDVELDVSIIPPGD